MLYLDSYLEELFFIRKKSTHLDNSVMKKIQNEMNLIVYVSQT